MAFLDPAHVLAETHLEPGSTVVDIGAGSGAYALAAGRAVGDGGQVYAIDVQKDLLLRLKSDAHAARLKNIQVINVDAEGGTKCGNNMADLVLLSNVLFQAEDKNALLHEAARIVKPGGEVLVVDWSESFGNLGPTPDKVVTRSKALQLGGGAGLIVRKEFDAGDHHYGLIFKKA